MLVTLTQGKLPNMTNMTSSIATIEAQQTYLADLYSRGKTLYTIYNDLDQGNDNQIDDFFINEFGVGGYTLVHSRPT